MHTLRPYQQTAVDEVLRLHRYGAAVCVVAPPGSGKTVIGTAIVQAAATKTLWVAHRRELIDQGARRLESDTELSVSRICPGFSYSPHAPIQVATVQTLLARSQRPEANLVVWDEHHHYAAKDWSRLREAYPAARHVGLTATPQRQDGSGLGDIAQELVVAANYQELVQAGYLVPCRVYQPPEHMGGNLALSPLAAYQRHAADGQAFCFAPSVKVAHRVASEFTAACIAAETITGKTSRADRDSAVRRFRTGQLRCLTNFNVLTEGVDVPQASVAILGRAFEHASSYLQATGRVLRPYDDKEEAIILDLSGATLQHGMPTDDREYSLTGSPIRRTQLEPLRNCLQCGATLPARLMVCPDCGYRFRKRDPRVPIIYSMELREVFAGAMTPNDAKQAEYRRLRALGRERGWALYFVRKEYKKLFGELPVIHDATDDEKRAELARLQRVQQERGCKPGFVAVMYKQTFGQWPSRRLTGG